MWNKRKEEEQPMRPPQTPPPAAPITKEANPPVPAAPAPTFHTPDSSRGSAVIGKSVMIKGQIFSREDLTIDGEIDGSVDVHEHRLTVGPNGKVQAGVKAREIVVLGTINGNVEASDKIDIRKDARLVGDIKTSRIVIEDGAYFKGSIDITRSEPARAEAPKAAASTPTASAPAAAPAQPAAPRPVAQNAAK